MSEIRAPITGSIFRLQAAVGDAVEVGDVVAVIESMKLEIPVETDVAGTVEQVHVAEGDAVAEDDVLFTLA